jgi:hypothetical protein
MFGFRKSQQMHKEADEEEGRPSIVMLLSEPVLPSAEEAIEMAKAAWSAAGPVEFLGAVGPHNFALRAAPLAFAIHAVGQPYDVNTETISIEQQFCWDNHKAWLAVDLPGKSAPALREIGQLAGAYKALMYFPFKHWSQKCLALYFPAEETRRATLPNRGDLIQSIRVARQNGIDLEFLKEHKTQHPN